MRFEILHHSRSDRPRIATKLRVLTTKLRVHHTNHVSVRHWQWQRGTRRGRMLWQRPPGRQTAPHRPSPLRSRSRRRSGPAAPFSRRRRSSLACRPSPASSERDCPRRGSLYRAWCRSRGLSAGGARQTRCIVPRPCGEILTPGNSTQLVSLLFCMVRHVRCEVQVGPFFAHHYDAHSPWIFSHASINGCSRWASVRCESTERYLAAGARRRRPRAAATPAPSTAAAGA